MEDFTPKIIGDNGELGVMLVQLYECPICHKKMISVPSSKSPFPMYWKLNVQSQLNAAGWGRMSSSRVDTIPICVTCSEAGLATFECAMCHQRWATSDIEESFGDPAEYLCKNCYAVVPAKAWNDKRKELNERHRWDFE